MTVEFTIPGRRRLPGQAEGEPPARASRPPRIACLLALAHRFDELVRSGAVRDYAELARVVFGVREYAESCARDSISVNRLNTLTEASGDRSSA